MKKYAVISEFWYKSHNKIYKPKDEIELTDREAGILRDKIKDIKEYKTKPIKDYTTK